MIADLKPYPEYKESSSAWIGMVPTHRNLTPNRALSEEGGFEAFRRREVAEGVLDGLLEKRGMKACCIQTRGPRTLKGGAA